MDTSSAQPGATAPPGPTGMTAEQRLARARRVAEELQHADYSHPVTECDLVMKGGITSGVVYPLAACELAKTHRFVNLGGSSAGAIAAGVVAAAEYDRDGGGFARLAQVPAEIGPNLASLFASGPKTVTAHAALMEMLDKTRPTGRRLRSVWGVLRRSQAGAFWGALAVGLVVAAVVAFLGAGPPTSVVAGLQFAFLFVLVGLVAVVAATAWALKKEAGATVQGLTEQGFGICVGSAPPGGAGAGPGAGGTSEGPGYLTDWIGGKIDEVAGLDRPLTFGDLEEKGIALQVMTTDLTHGMPRKFPFLEEGEFMFDEEELGAYFSPAVMRQLCDHGEPATLDGQPLVSDSGRQLRMLPAAKHIPVVMAARVSLSFPALISAVPLWALGEKGRSGEVRTPVRCWFSDGGMTSNFPLHLFDSLWPRRPTFALDLQPYHPAYPGQDIYYGGAKGRMPRVKTIETPGAFFSAILNTMQYWSDDQQARMPGFRDRIVEVRLSGTEGGMNLRMPDEVIAVVAAKGRDGAAAISSDDPGPDFPGAAPTGRFDLERHRRVRLASSLGHLQEGTAALGPLYRDILPDGSPGFREVLGSDEYARQMAEVLSEEGDGSAEAWDAAAAQACVDQLVGFATAAPDLSQRVGRPKGRLGVTPQT